MAARGGGIKSSLGQRPGARSLGSLPRHPRWRGPPAAYCSHALVGQAIVICETASLTAQAADAALRVRRYAVRGSGVTDYPVARGKGHREPVTGRAQDWRDA